MSSEEARSEDTNKNKTKHRNELIKLAILEFKISL